MGTPRADARRMQIALRTAGENGGPVVYVSGSLGAVGVPLLRDALAAFTRGATLDLRELVAASPEGLTALRELQGNGHRVRNASPYLTLRLQEMDQTEDAPAGPGVRNAAGGEGET